jgi:predicted enzyme related to lactoylglutathione lyase
MRAYSPLQRLLNPVRGFGRRWLFAAFLCAAGAIPVMAASSVLPAIVDPATQEHHNGKVIFVELVTPDLAAAEKFYGGLFGWTFNDIKTDTLEYAEASLDGHPVAGLIHKAIASDEHKQPAWLTFISSDNIETRKELALRNGAKVLFGPKDIPGRGREAVFADPQGAVFAVLDSTSGDPPDVLPEPGEWIWSSLITRDPDTDAAFYQEFFDYDIFSLPPDKHAQHLLLASDDYARASVNSLPTKGRHSHPHWLNYVRVKDTEEMARKVVALGGHVLVKPRIDRHGGKIAVVSDPQGAPFGLIEWTAMDSKEVPQ